MGKYHRAKVKAPEKADNIKQRITKPHGITEKTEEKKPGKGLGEYKSFIPLYGKCDECETSWASESRSKLHKNVNRVKFTQHLQLQSVMKVQQNRMNETSISRAK